MIADHSISARGLKVQRFARGRSVAVRFSTRMRVPRCCRERDGYSAVRPRRVFHTRYRGTTEVSFPKSERKPPSSPDRRRRYGRRCAASPAATFLASARPLAVRSAMRRPKFRASRRHPGWRAQARRNRPWYHAPVPPTTAAMRLPMACQPLSSVIYGYILARYWTERPRYSANSFRNTWRPVRDSNPRCRRERAVSWASRRTGRRPRRAF